MRDAAKCDGCGRATYDVEKVALLVTGQLTAERDLCRACRSCALDGFLTAFAPWLIDQMRT